MKSNNAVLSDSGKNNDIAEVKTRNVFINHEEQWRDEEKRSNINLSGIERYVIFKEINFFYISSIAWSLLNIRSNVI